MRKQMEGGEGHSLGAREEGGEEGLVPNSEGQEEVPLKSINCAHEKGT